MIAIVEVKTKRDLKKWVNFPTCLYKDNKYYVPKLRIDELNAFNERKNPAYEFCETKLFLAYKDGVLAGRIAALINHAYIKKVNQNLIRFTRLDAIDDLEVTKALINAVEEVGKSRGLSKIMGPIGFTDLDEQGMLIYGFNEQDMSITIYNHEYYVKHLEALGFKKDVDWLEFQLFIPEDIPDRLKRVSEIVKKRYGINRIDFKNRRQIKKRAMDIFKLLDAAYIKLYGTVPLTEKVSKEYIKNYIPLLNIDYTIALRNPNDEIVGFGVFVPSTAKALQKNKGRLGPIKLLRLLKSLKCKNEIVELFLIAVRPDYQNHGLTALIIEEGLKGCLKHGVKMAETGPMLEINHKVLNSWLELKIKNRQHRARRCWIKEIKK